MKTSIKDSNIIPIKIHHIRRIAGAVAEGGVAGVIDGAAVAGEHVGHYGVVDAGGVVVHRQTQVPEPAVADMKTVGDANIFIFI